MVLCVGKVTTKKIASEAPNLEGNYFQMTNMYVKIWKVIRLEITKVSPIFPITRVYLQDKQGENKKSPSKKPVTSFVSLLEKELRQKTSVDIRC